MMNSIVLGGYISPIPPTLRDTLPHSHQMAEYMKLEDRDGISSFLRLLYQISGKVVNGKGTRQELGWSERHPCTSQITASQIGAVISLRLGCNTLNITGCNPNHVASVLAFLSTLQIQVSPGQSLVACTPPHPVGPESSRSCSELPLSPSKCKSSE